MYDSSDSYVLVPMPSKRWRLRMQGEGFVLPRSRIGASVWVKFPQEWYSVTYKKDTGYLGIIYNEERIPQYWFRLACNGASSMFEAIPADVAKAMGMEE